MRDTAPRGGRQKGKRGGDGQREIRFPKLLLWGHWASQEGKFLLTYTSPIRPHLPTLLHEGSSFQRHSHPSWPSWSRYCYNLQIRPARPQFIQCLDISRLCGWSGSGLGIMRWENNELGTEKSGFSGLLVLWAALWLWMNYCPSPDLRIFTLKRKKLAGLEFKGGKPVFWGPNVTTYLSVVVRFDHHNDLLLLNLHVFKERPVRFYGARPLPLPLDSTPPFHTLPWPAWCPQKRLSLQFLAANVKLWQGVPLTMLKIAVQEGS